MILATSWSRRSSSATRSRNGRVPAFELFRSPITRPSSAATPLANGTACPVAVEAGESSSIVRIPATSAFRASAPRRVLGQELLDAHLRRRERRALLPFGDELALWKQLG